MAARKEKEPDPPAQIASLASALARAELPRAVIVRGEERWFRDRAVEAVLAAAEKRGLEIARHDALDPDLDLGGLTNDLLAPPMFAGARCVLVRNATRALKKAEDGEETALTRAVLAFLKEAGAPGPSLGLLVLDADGLRADHAVVKAAQARGEIVLALRKLWYTAPPWDPDPRKSELAQWLGARARDRRVALSPDEAAYVVAATGNDLYALAGALDRVAQRGCRSVADLVGWSNGGSPFDAAEMLLSGDPGRAIAAVEVLFRSGFRDKSGEREADRTALLSILFGSLRSKLRQSLSGALALERGLDIAAAADRAQVPAYPKARAEYAARLRGTAASTWQRRLDDLTDLERRTRSGGTVDATDLALLALRWRGPARSAPRAR
jgi:DNA polymerase III delta subunit